MNSDISTVILCVCAVTAYERIELAKLERIE